MIENAPQYYGFVLRFPSDRIGPFVKDYASFTLTLPEGRDDAVLEDILTSAGFVPCESARLDFGRAAPAGPGAPPFWVHDYRWDEGKDAYEILTSMRVAQKIAGDNTGIKVRFEQFDGDTQGPMQAIAQGRSPFSPLVRVETIHPDGRRVPQTGLTPNTGGAGLQWPAL